MKKSSLRNNILLLGALLLGLAACKAKQAHPVEKKEEPIEVAEKQGERIEPKEEIIIHKPGMINQKHLDSIKAVRKLQKRKIK